MSVVESTVTSVTKLAAAYLAVCEDALALTAGGIPDPSYVYPVEPVIDCCPALIVFVSSLSEETTSPISPPASTGHRASYGRLNLVQLTAWSLRCGPKINADGTIDLAEISWVSRIVQEDGWSMWNRIYKAINDSTFLDICTAVHFDRASVIREQGGCLGWSMSVRAELGGIPNPPGT